MDYPAAGQSPHEEQLVAYLDGELEADARRDLEARLAADPALEAELRRLEQAWDLLDRLPRADVDDAFARSTVEMVAVRAADDQRDEQATVSVQRRGWWAAGLGGALVAGVLGFLIVGALVPDPNDSLLGDLTLLENLDAYRQTGDIEFLRLLRDEKVIAPTAQGGTLSGVAAYAPRQADSLDARRAYVAALAPEQQGDLRRRQERFEQLSLQEQERLWALDAALAADPDGANLRRMMTQYHEWLQEFPAERRAEIVHLSPPERADQIQRMLAEEAARAAARLSPEDYKVLLGWLEGPILAALPPRKRANLLQVEEDARHRMMFMELMRRGRGPDGQGSGVQIDAEDIERLKGQLSEPARKKLEDAGNLGRQKKQIFEWLRAQRWGRRPSGNAFEPMTGELGRFFKELSSEEQKRLLSRSPDDMQREVWMLYLQRQGEEGKGRGGPAGDMRGGPYRDGRGGESRGGYKSKLPIEREDRRSH